MLARNLFEPWLTTPKLAEAFCKNEAHPNLVPICKSQWGQMIKVPLLKHTLAPVLRLYLNQFDIDVALMLLPQKEPFPPGKLGLDQSHIAKLCVWSKIQRVVFRRNPFLEHVVVSAYQ